MNCQQLKAQFSLLTKNFRSCSVVNADGALLFSKDLNNSLLTTTRLVAFQIVKKYLQPQPKDLFILNDPENGGFQFSSLIFITSITPNLFLIWDEEFSFIDFKIPPTPLFDKGVKNDFVWKALVNNQSYSAEFENLIFVQKTNIDSLSSVPGLIETLSSQKSQQQWLKSTEEIFDILFNVKAQGSCEAHYKIAPGQIIKLKLTIEEKQNIKLFTLDLAHTNLAVDFHAASHVVESAAIKKIIDYYDLGEFFTQAIIDKIKIVLPPRSIVSKPHAEGAHNIGIQAICSQLCDYLLQQLNSPSRKPHSAFQYVNFLNFKIQSGRLQYNNTISRGCSNLESVESLVNLQKIAIKTMSRTESKSHIVFEITSEEPLNLMVLNRYETDDSDISFKVNNTLKTFGSHTLKKADLIEIEWKF